MDTQSRDPHPRGTRECRRDSLPRRCGSSRARVSERCCTDKVHRARQRGRGVRYDDLLRLVVVAGVPSSCAARTPFLISVVLVRTAADGPMRQNRWAGRRWHRAAPAGCAGARLEPFGPNLPAQWTRPRGRLSGLSLPGGASHLTDHPVLHHARRRARRLKYEWQRGRGRRDGHRRLLRRRSRSRGDHRLR